MDQKHTDYRFVMVVWRDSFSSYGWRDLDSLDSGMIPIVSCGWLVRETATQITLVGSVTENGNGDSPMTIPLEAIVYMDDVALPDIEEQLDAARNPEQFNFT